MQTARRGVSIQRSVKKSLTREEGGLGEEKQQEGHRSRDQGEAKTSIRALGSHTDKPEEMVRRQPRKAKQSKATSKPNHLKPKQTLVCTSNPT